MTEDRTVRKVIGEFELWDGRRARMVVVTYDDDASRIRELEVENNEKFVPKYRELGEFKSNVDTVPVPVLVELITGLENKVSKHDYDGSAEEYRGYSKATDEAIEAIKQIMMYVAKDAREV
jgi:hypothetical protein